MARRRFLLQVTGALAAGVFGACSPRRPPRVVGRTPAIRAVCFDLFTLFDPRSVVAVAEQLAPGRGQALCDIWRVRQFEYAWLRAAAGRYADFRQVTEESLIYAARARGLDLDATQREKLIAAYSQLEPWSDTQDVLAELKRQGLLLAPLANYAPDMLHDLVAHAGMTDLFDALISTDRARTFKPDPRAYALGPEILGVPREQIVFSAFGGWDAAGARWYGYPTFWVNRLGVAAEQLDAGPHTTGPTLAELQRFVSSWPERAV